MIDLLQSQGWWRWLRGAPGRHWPLTLLLATVLVLQPAARAALPSQQRAEPASRSGAPGPFLYSPFYGSASVLSRVNSYFDHDKPWYANDRIFVRFDGRRWKGRDVSVLNCDPGHTCYDGHNGYDLHMHFEPVLSAASGSVINAGWYNPLNHNDAFGLWVTIDHGNGFANVYGHLSAITVSAGEHVGNQWQIGTSGTTGSSSGPHLHFGTYYYPSWQPTDPFGWTGQGRDPNTVVDYNLWAGTGSSTPVPLLAGQGSRLAPGAVLVDDGSSGWSSTGQWSTTSAKSDIGGSLHWTSTTNGAPTATSTWQTMLPADGYYEVGVFVDDNHASSGWASYTITSNDPAQPNHRITRRVEVDQEHVGTFQNAFGSVNTGAQWLGLGTYYFKADQPATVTLDNATGENNQQLAADALEFAPLTPPRYGFTLMDDTTPATMTPGSNVLVELTLSNTSSFPWPATGLNSVEIIYRWLDSQGHTVITSSPTALRNDLQSNASTTREVEVQAPMQAGTYTLQWDLLQDGQVFSQHGAHSKNDSVTVLGPQSTPIATPAASPPATGTQVPRTPVPAPSASPTP